MGSASSLGSRHILSFLGMFTTTMLLTHSARNASGDLPKLYNVSENPSHESEQSEETSEYLCADGLENSELLGAPQKLSKAQKRRNKKSQKEKERVKAIAEQELENLTGNRFIESAEIAKKLSERQLAIHEVPSDGNCLYTAIEHQLSTLNLEKMTVKSLRELTSKYLLSHKEDYLPFLTDPDTGDTLSDEQYIKYCEDIINTTAWGGQIEIQVLSKICGKPIEVIQAEGPSIIAGDEASSPKLIISYHRHAYGLGEHYNSVVPCLSNQIQELKSDQNKWQDKPAKAKLTSEANFTSEEMEILLKSSKLIEALLKWAETFERCSEGLKCNVCQTVLKFNFENGDNFDENNMPVTFRHLKYDLCRYLKTVAHCENLLTAKELSIQEKKD
ncbi:OTU domain-containing protein 6B [Araneus ventricosus]|uniref:ubiquitinyl hydrolase 1 n=1 Tax=Araneus ventricosus TaxID=182803 RepID=A0A4Y2B984_ARAVE|nr:OTU domain-containing protein 6B [Araneus ventricosus]